MPYGAPDHPVLLPHPDLGLARGCEHCLGWGTVVTRDGEHALCHICQPDPAGDEGTTGSAPSSAA